MNMDYSEFIHPNHSVFFIAAAKKLNCHILIRKTGRAALSWVGKRGYTGKRADLKAKTANLNIGSRPIAGLVCSPFLRPEAFTADRLTSAQEMWAKSAHLITVPNSKAGFADDIQPRGCLTPYMVQSNPNHRHFGCVALVEMGLLMPRYVHGDYDLYAIVPANQNFNPDAIPIRRSTLGTTMSPDGLSHKALAQMQVPNFESPLSFQLANYINTNIAMSSPDLLGSLMVNHGEQVNIGPKGYTYEPVLAILAQPKNGQWARILVTREDHEQFYREN
ncbi:MAG: hypothetical protein R3F53_00685 [Gammaproteobacteria bacterium]